MANKNTPGGAFSVAKPAVSNFATENRGKRRKPQTHLEYDVIRAEALGYGCHYGAYKADHPDTTAEYEARTGAKESKKLDPDKAGKKCLYCGDMFYAKKQKKNKKYCCDDCRMKAVEEARKEKAKRGSV